MRGRRRALLLALWIALPAAARAGTDPRVERANALLASEKTYPEAIELYRAALADDPAQRDARLHLAQVLSWSSHLDESVVEYDALLARWPDDLEARLGRAEVLSWAGRSVEATAAFSAVLAAEPRNARARRGLARVQRWSGDLARADASYRSALELEENAEARAEWQQMRAGLHSGAEARGRFFADNGSYDRYDLEAHARRPFGFATELGARLARTSLHGRELDGTSGDDDANSVELLLERRLGPRWRVGGGAGMQAWVDAKDLFVGHLELGFSPDAATSLGLSVEHGSQLELSDALAPVQAGLSQTGYSASAWRDLGGGFDLWTRGQLNTISDGNLRETAELAVGLAPIPSQKLRVSLAGSFLRYEQRSDLYYDPDLDLSARLGIHYRIELGSRLSLGLGASGGVAYTRTLNPGALPGGGSGQRASDVGPIGGVEGDARYAIGAWRLAANAGYSGTLRAGRYRGVSAGAGVERSF